MRIESQYTVKADYTDTRSDRRDIFQNPVKIKRCLKERRLALMSKVNGIMARYSWIKMFCFRI